MNSAEGGARFSRSVRAVLAGCVVGGRLFVGAADLVFLGSPRAEIDLLAALGTEGTEAVLGSPADISTAAWAFDYSDHSIKRSIANSETN
ncbi:hypothetical protein J2802_006087 [Paraburkholderia caribensis]|nr:hypothetical protein [Paraburkholderia caribensis]